MINREITPFFSFALWALSIGIFQFCFQNLQNSFPWVHPFLFCSGLWNKHLHAKHNTFKSININILVFRKIANFWYITCVATSLSHEKHGSKLIFLKMQRKSQKGLRNIFQGIARLPNKFGLMLCCSIATAVKLGKSILRKINNHFIPMFHIFNNWKPQRGNGFQAFSGGMKIVLSLYF